jgi:hypothetical protein
MRMKSLARVAAALALFAVADSAHAQGSWLPYGTLGASDIAVSPSGVVWLVAREPRSIRSTLVLAETQFVTPRGRASPARVAVDASGFPWLLNTDGSVWHWVRNSAGKEDWVQSPLKAIDIAVGASGAVWAIDTDRRIVRLRDGAWESIGGSGARISVDPSGNPWIVSSAGKISRWTGNAWAELPGTASDITIAPDGTAFILGTAPVRGGFEVLRFNGSAWEPIVGGAGVAISAGSQAVFVAQDTTTNLVLSSLNARLRAGGAEPSAQTTTSAALPNAGGNVNGAMPSSATPPASTPVTTNAVETARNAVATTAPAAPPAAPAAASGNDKGGSSLPLPSAGSVVGAIGALGGLLSKGASVAVAAAPVVPNPNAVAATVGTAVGGAVAGAAAGAVLNTAGGALSNVASGGASGSPPSTPAQNAPAKVNPPDQPGVSAPRPSLKVPMPGSLRCPIIGGGATMEKGCELLGRAAMKLRQAPSADCVAPACADSRNGGECWTCPASFSRGSAAIDSEDACVGPESKRSVATLVQGCAKYKAPPGYGTPFRDAPNGSECWVCPLPLQRSWSAITSLTKGILAACFGKAKELLVWQLGQYPEAGSYRFMPGLLSIALADPKAVDAFLEKRADGDTARKRAIWAEMIADPSGSAELKALLFASLLRVAKDSASAAATDAVGEFESYIRARRSYVADEALRMYRKANEVYAFYRQAKDSISIARAGAEAVETAATDFKTYAWSAVMPDSAGTAFIAASAALSQLGVSGGVEGVTDAAISSLNARYLEPVTKALESQLDMLQDKSADMIEKAGASALASGARALKGADGAMIGTTLLAGAMKVSKGVMSLFGKDKLAAEYEKYVEEMGAPVKVRQMLESTNPEDRQTLLLYWALATSPHKASDRIGTGAMTGAELCSSDAWTIAQCSSAKAKIAAAAKAAGYSN